jgi:hypothetical protein
MHKIILILYIFLFVTHSSIAQATKAIEKFRKTDSIWHLPEKIWFDILPPVFTYGSHRYSSQYQQQENASRSLDLGMGLTVNYLFTKRSIIRLAVSGLTEFAIFEEPDNIKNINCSYGYYNKCKHGSLILYGGLSYINANKKTTYNKYLSGILFKGYDLNKINTLGLNFEINRTYRVAKTSGINFYAGTNINVEVPFYYFGIGIKSADIRLH